MLIALVAGLAGLAAVDRGAAALAGRRLGERVAGAYRLPGRPQVRVAGFPFLTQVLGGKYRAVDISVPSVAAGGVEVTGLDARVTGVRASVAQLLGRQSGPLTADRASATATVPLSALVSKLPPGLTLRQDGNALRVGGTVYYLGLTVPLAATVTARATPSGITLTPQHVHLGGDAVGGTVSIPAGLMAEWLQIAVPLGTLPLRLQITSVSVAADGLRIAAAGRDVQFRAARPATADGPGHPG
jgi:LmeA-like phospholipid-binding